MTQPVRDPVARHAHLCKLLAALLLVGACAVKAPFLDAPWPEDPQIPVREWFGARYASDTGNQQHQRPSEYLRWVVRFYYGWLNHPQGWLDVSARALDATGESADSETARRLTLLGRRIAAEWAKASLDRLIDNRTLAVWFRALSIAAEQDAVDPTIIAVARDVDALFTAQLTRGDISLARYFTGFEEPPTFER